MEVTMEDIGHIRLWFVGALLVLAVTVSLAAAALGIWTDRLRARARGPARRAIGKRLPLGGTR
jgi:hypothetical protein